MAASRTKAITLAGSPATHTHVRAAKPERRRDPRGDRYDHAGAFDPRTDLSKPVRGKRGPIETAAVAVDDPWTPGGRSLAAVNRRVDVLCANAGRGLGHAFLDQDFADIQRVLETNVTGTVHLLHRVGQGMREQRSGRILITGSIAGFMPGTYQAVYNATKAFLDSFSYALRHELLGSGVTVTCLMPGATDTEFFERAGMTDTKVGQGKKDDPGEVARIGFDAMMRGEADVVSGFKNKVQVAMANVTPGTVLAEQHRAKAEPGSANEK